ncbi:MFS transporter [Arthrobacter celericrescens]|uniref:MFS transporter n=1 Tax=Arthrobacter celericrescens TaxID=2320851 RepID=UPI000EA176B4|nr:MFS transporter [Arthrobacter celericrescens]
MPILMLGYIVGYLDRTSISFASQGLNKEFGMNASAFGFAVGIFFLGYVLFEVPSNVLLHRVGARLWIARIMISWGIITVLIGFSTGVEWVYILRFLLGVAEAGFFPGIILYLTYWFPNAIRARMLSIFMLSVSIALASGSLLNGQILYHFDGFMGFSGWRWIFFVGGILAMLLGVLSFFLLTDSPQKARWLAEDERSWLVQTLEAENQERAAGRTNHGTWAGLRDRRVLLLALVFFLIQFGNYPLAFWLPQLVKSIGPGLSGVQVSLLTAVPYACAATVLLLMALRFARRDSQVSHIAVPLIIATGAFAVITAALGQPLVALIAITVAVMCVLPATAMFWSLPTHYLTGAAAASGIAFINSVGNIAGFVSPYSYGVLRDVTGSDNFALATLGAAVFIASAVLISWRMVTAKRHSERPVLLETGH